MANSQKINARIDADTATQLAELVAHYNAGPGPARATTSDVIRAAIAALHTATGLGKRPRGATP